MEYIIDIITDQTISPMFIRANGFLIDKHSSMFIGLDLESKNAILADLWSKTYNAELIKDSKVWSKIKFADSKSMTMFQLRWS